MVSLNKKEILKMVSIKEAIHAMESAFIHLSNGTAHIPPRLNFDFPDKNASSLVMPAYAIGNPYYCVKIVSINYFIIGSLEVFSFCKSFKLSNE